MNGSKLLNRSGMILTALAAVMAGGGCCQCDLYSGSVEWESLFNGKDLTGIFI